MPERGKERGGHAGQNQTQAGRWGHSLRITLWKYLSSVTHGGLNEKPRLIQSTSTKKILIRGKENVEKGNLKVIVLLEN